MEDGFFKQTQKGIGKGRKQFAVLVDPDKSMRSLKKLAVALRNPGGFLLFRGSLLRHGNGEKQIRILRENSPIPCDSVPRKQPADLSQCPWYFVTVAYFGEES